MIALSWPGLRASYRYLPVELAIRKYFATRDIASDRLPVLIDYARAAIGHQDHYRFHDGLSVLQLLRAQDYATPALDRRAAYEEAAAAAEASLQRAPAQSATWSRLAMLRWTLREEPSDVIAAWKMSVFTGRTHPTILIERLQVGFAYHVGMDAEAVAMLRDQFLLAWRMQPGSLVRMLNERDQGLGVTRRLIADTDPLALSEIEAWLERLR